MTESSLDLLLKGRSQEFIERVRALVQRYNIDENDPTFILLIGTTTLEVLLEKCPQEFDQLFGQLLSQMEQRWGLLQREWALSAQESATAAQQLTQALTGIEQTAAAQQETIRKQAGSQAALLTTVYLEQVKQLNAEAAKLAAHATASAQATAAEQVKDIAKRLRQAYYLEAAGFACLGASLLFATGWAFGWTGHSTRASKSVWADLERWNTEELQACNDAGKNTCNFHIEVPKGKNE
jgi:hypothetical protein